MAAKEKERVFRFKQFQVRHSVSPMKVGVDGVLLGAWARVPEHGDVLDVGTGCGLIALMAAQRSQCRITGIDIDAGAVEEAATNFDASPWVGRLWAKDADFLSVTGKWDSIISNPPFFDAGPVEKSARMVARHVGTLSPLSLVGRAPEILSESGTLSLIAPCDMFPSLEAAARRSGMTPARVAFVSTVEGQAPKRVLCEFSKKSCPKEESHFAIEASPGAFTEAYIALTRDFYLRF